jgi:GT2 family glycosyltransferase
MRMKQRRFAGFIMTYQRTEVLADTVERIFNQSLAPEKLLIVDNSSDRRTREFVLRSNDYRLEYYAVGYNSGPAGAAKIGLEKLTAEGYDWIYWGDDDDPPTFVDTFEKLFEIIVSSSNENTGIVGAVGQFFNNKTGKIERVPNRLIATSGSLSVDSIAGNQMMIVNANLIKSGVLPDPDLFFGFEELDFCIKTKRKGFEILVSNDLFRRAREKYSRVEYRKPFYNRRSLKALTREYYSCRNMIAILIRNKLFFALAFSTMRYVAKAFYGFLFGVKYGELNFDSVMCGLSDGFLRRLGKREGRTLNHDKQN